MSATSPRRHATMRHGRFGGTGYEHNASQVGMQTSSNWHTALVNTKTNRQTTSAAATSSLNLFPFDGPTRTLCRKIASNKFFEWFILLMILLNCASLAVQDPTEEDDVGRNKFLNDAEYVFVAVFGLEMVIKVIASGFIWCGPQSYLRNSWNVLDFFIVVLGFADVAASSIGLALADVKALRAFRVLRPLRLITSLTSLQLVVNSILASVPRLVNVGFLLIFLMVIYAIIGLEFYRGVLRTQCNTPFTNGTGTFYEPVEEGPICSIDGDGYQCPDPTVCRKNFEGPNDGVTMFDNVGLAILTVFQCVTLEGWTEVLYNTDDALGSSANWFYFVSLVVLGAFFVLNLVLGVLSGQFTREGERLNARKRFMKQQTKRKVERDVQNYQEWLRVAEQLAFQETSATTYPGRLNPYDRHTALSALTKRTELPPLEDNQSSDTLDREFGEYTLLVLVRTYSGVVLRIPCEPNETIGDVRYKVQQLRPQYETRMVLPVSGKPVSENTLISDTSLVLRTEEELAEINSLDETNARALLKPSTLQLVTSFGVVMRSHFAAHVVSFLVLVNTIVLAMQHVNQSDAETTFFDTAEVVFVIIFFFEIVLKLYALGWSEYWRSKFNRFDLVVVATSILELIIVQSTGSRSVGISVFRCARLMRAFRYTRYWEDMNDLANSLVRSISSICSLLVLVFIFMVITALLGMQIFGGRFDFEEGVPRTNFDDFWAALLAVFQVLTGEDWNAVMYDGIRAYGGIHDRGVVSVIYFCLLFLLGNFVLLNVFLAIAVKSLDDARACRERRELVLSKIDGEPETAANRGARRSEYANPTINPPSQQRREQEILQEAQELSQAPEYPYIDVRVHRPEDNPVKPLSKYRSLWLFGPDSTFRSWCNRISFNPYFDKFIFLLIGVSSIMLALEDPVNEDAQINKSLEFADYFFLAIFTAEMSMKIVSLGLVLHPGAYLRDPWNVLDGLVVTGGILNYALQSLDVSAIRILRVLRVLRPLRAIKRQEGLRHVVQCMIVSIKTIGNVFIVTFLFQFIFAVIGVQRFKGTFDYCSDMSIQTEGACTGTFVDPESGDTVDREWIHPDFNFDNLPNAMLLLFSVSTFEGWVGFMNQAIDGTEEGMGPIENNNRAVGLYFIAYIVVIAFFMVNIFVGYVIVVFSAEGESANNSGLDSNQRKCVEYAINAKPIRKFFPQYRAQRAVWSVVMSRNFEYLVLTAIGANSIFLMMQYDGMDSDYEQILVRANYFFTAFFTVEAVLKLFAQNPTVYFSDSWNILDFVIVVGSIIDVALAGKGVSVSFLRLFRVARLLKIISKGENMKRLLWTFGQSLVALPYVGLLIALLFFVYAVIGMQLFGRVELSDDREVNRHNNFRTFPRALLVLFRSATGENWQLIMKHSELSESAGECTTNPLDGGKSTCGSNMATPFFVSFFILCSFLVLNLFVAVIMDNFEYLTMDAAVLGPHHLPRFAERWADFDPGATRRIHFSHLIDLLATERPPLGFGEKAPRRHVWRMLMTMNIPLARDGTVHFNAVLLSIVRLRLGIYIDDEVCWQKANLDLATLIKDEWGIPANTLRELLPPPSDDNPTVGMLYAVRLLQDIFRRRGRKQADVFTPVVEPVAGFRTVDLDMPLDRAGSVENLMVGLPGHHNHLASSRLLADYDLANDSFYETYEMEPEFDDQYFTIADV
eukprot:m.38383 g.38383  ORF g.38383 m.38383 type:complete len:1677 (-) comp5887_c0_seq1:4731-9761(-)